MLISIDWEEIIGKTIETVEIDYNWAEANITFTDGFKIKIDGGSSSGYPILEINKVLEEK